MGEEYPSPDGKYVLYLSCNEVRMSHWVCNPDLLEKESGRTIYEGGHDIDASDVKWSEDSSYVRFYMRTYPGSVPGKYVRLVIVGVNAILQDEP